MADLTSESSCRRVFGTRRSALRNSVDFLRRHLSVACSALQPVRRKIEDPAPREFAGTIASLPQCQQGTSDEPRKENIIMGLLTFREEELHFAFGNPNTSMGLKLFSGCL